MALVVMTDAVPGTLASSAEYNKLIDNILDLDARLTKYKEARSSGDETVTTSVTDVNGATLSVTTPQASTQVLVTSVWDVGTTGGSDTFLGTLYVDNVLVTVGEAHFEGAGSERSTISQSWLINVGTAGAHTFKLRRQKSGSTDTVTLFGTHTKIICQGNGIT